MNKSSWEISVIQSINDEIEKAFNQGKAYENIEWLEGHRCFECGKEKEAGTSDLCGECLEEK